jgi:hypothetical protein
MDCSCISASTFRRSISMSNLSLPTREYKYYTLRMVSLASLVNAWRCDRSLGGIAGSNPAENMSVSLFSSVVCCHKRLLASPVSWSRAECGVSEYDRDASIIRRPCRRVEKKI